MTDRCRLESNTRSPYAPLANLAISAKTNRCDLNSPGTAATIAGLSHSGPANPPGRRRCQPRILGFAFVLIASLSALGVALQAYAQADFQPPTVIAQSPSSNAKSQAVSANVTATFSEAIQPASVTFVLRDSGGSAVSASLSYDASTFTMTLHPNAELIASRTYTATVSGAMDLAGNLMTGPDVWSFSTGQPGFQESVVFSGLDSPTAFQFASDGRVFVAQKSGLILVFNSLTSTSPTIFADLQPTWTVLATAACSVWRSIRLFRLKPYIYVLYTRNWLVRWVSGGCAISRLQANGSLMTGAEQVLVEDWYQQYPDQPVGNLAFGPDGSLYAVGWRRSQLNLGGYRPDRYPKPRSAEQGGALRSQDLRTPADPVTLGRLRHPHPAGHGPSRFDETTSMVVGTPTVDANGVKSYPVTSVFQGSQPLIVRVLEPTNPAPGRPRRFLYVLPVEAGVTNLSSTVERRIGRIAPAGRSGPFQHDAYRAIVQLRTLVR